MKLLLSAALLLTLTLTLRAEVYLLAPLRQRSGKYLPAPAELSNGSSSKPMFTTPVVVNGRKFDLEVYRFKEHFETFVKQLRARFPQAIFHAGKDFLRVTFTGSNSNKEYWLFTGSGFHNGVTGFRLPGAGKLDRPEWSRELPPLPVDGRAELVVKLPQLNGTFGSFSGIPQEPARALASYSAMLRSLNWQPTGAESSPAIRGRGELFIRTTPRREVMWVNFSADGGGVFYHKTITK